MNRRQFLRAAVAAGGPAALGAGITSGGRAASGTPLASGSRPYRPVGRAAVPGATEVVADGDVAFVADRTGFASVDVSEPRAPRVVGGVEDVAADREGGPLRDVWDAKLAGDRLVVAGPAIQDIDALHGFAVYDVGDPAAPERVTFQPTGAAIHNCFATADHVFVPRTDTPREDLLVFDLDGDDARQVAEWSLLDHDERWELAYHGLYQLHDLWVQGGVAYLAQWDAGVVVLDVRDPSTPRFVTRFGGQSWEHLHAVSGNGGKAITREGLQPPGNVHAVGTDESGDLLAVGRESWDLDPGDDRGGASGIDLYDVSDPAAPRLLATIDPPPSGDQTRDGRFTTAHNFHFAGDRLYSAWYHGGVKIHDVADPANPEQLTWWQRPAEAKFWGTAEPAGDAFVASNMGVEPDWGDASLYVFPDEAAPDADPSTAPVRTPTPAPTATPSTATTTPTGSATGRPGTRTTATSPGFGLGTALTGGAGLLAGWLARRR